MARIAGVDLPDNKRSEIGLTYMYGVGLHTAREILGKAGHDKEDGGEGWKASVLKK